MRDETQVAFESATGHRLAGRLRLPTDRPRAFVLFAHCFTCGKDLRIARRISARLAEQGFGVLRFDFTGLGESEGELADTTFSSNLDDLRAAADYLRTEYAAPAILLGHSLGGAAMLAVAGDIPESVAVATIGAPADPAHVRNLLGADAARIEAEGQAQVSIAGRCFMIGADFLHDLQRHSNLDHLGRLGKALLVMHSPQDNVVGIDNATRIFTAARHPRSFVSLDGADHLLSRPQDADYAGITIAAWASRYLPEAETGAAESGVDTLAEGVVRATLTNSGYAVDVQAGHHRLRGDEPVNVGGTDTGPSPYSLLLAALGSCTAITLQMYAKRKGYKLGGVEVTLEHGRLHTKDCADCDAKQGRVDVIERHIEIHGELSAEQRVRLMEIADRCPVHRTLENEIKVRTTGGD